MKHTTLIIFLFATLIGCGDAPDSEPDETTQCREVEFANSPCIAINCSQDQDEDAWDVICPSESQ